MPSAPCFNYYPRVASSWLCLKATLIPWTSAVEPVLPWCLWWLYLGTINSAWPTWTPLLRSNSWCLSKWDNLDPLAQARNSGVVVLLQPSHINWLARSMELPCHRNTISLATSLVSHMMGTRSSFSPWRWPFLTGLSYLSHQRLT